MSSDKGTVSLVLADDPKPIHVFRKMIQAIAQGIPAGTKEQGMTEVYDIKLPPNIQKVLVTIVNFAEKENVLSMAYLVVKQHSGEFDVYVFAVGMRRESFADIRENPVFCLEAMGFIRIRSSEKSPDLVFLTQLAFEWVKYQQKKPLAKVIYRGWRMGKRNAAILITVLITAITTALAVLQILQLLKVIKP